MRILCLPEGNSIAHVSRLLEIAKELRSRGHECHFAGFGNCLDVVDPAGFPRHGLPGWTAERVVTAFRTGNSRVLYGDASEIERFVEAERALYRTLRPDLVLVDYRPSADLSTRLEGLPHAAVVNAHLTNYAVRPMVMPFYRRADPPSALVRAIWRLQAKIEQGMYERSVLGFNQLYARRGLPRPRGYELAAGRDLTLLADDPNFTPLRRTPPGFHFVGLMTWRSGLPQIPDFDTFLAYPRRIFMALGSGGFEEALGQLARLRDEGTAYCLAAGSLAARANPDDLPHNVRVVRYVNADLLLPHCHAAICHGGNGTLYQLLQHGVPMISLPCHGEQDYNARRIHQLGVGRRLPGRLLKTDLPRVAAAARALIDDPWIRERVAAWKQRLRPASGGEGPTRAANLIDAHFTSRKTIHACTSPSC